MEIIRVTEENALKVSRIYAEGWKTGYKGIIDQDYLDSIPLDRWAKSVGNSQFHGFVLVENGEYIATSTIAPARDDDMTGWGEIISMYVLPNHFRQGYGRIMFQYVVKQLKEMGYSKIYLWVLEDNHNARAFYSNNGFIPTDKAKLITFGGNSHKEVMYINDLK